MINKFLNKINNKEYISKTLYEFIYKNFNDQIPYNFDIEIYNEICLEQGYKKYQELFNEEGILDKEIIKKLLTDEEYVNVKDSIEKNKIITSKIKYLVNIQNIKSDQILIICFSTKLKEQLKQKLYLELKINTNIKEICELGYEYIIEKNKEKKCYEITKEIKDKIFYDYFKQYIFKDKKKLGEIIETNKEMFDSYFIDNYKNYIDYEEYFKDFKKYIIKSLPDLEQEIKRTIENNLGQEKIKTLKGELAKSKGEAIIADFLTKNNIEYEYVQLNEVDIENKKPDFTVINDEGEKIYIDYDVIPFYENIENNKKNQITINCLSSDEIIKELVNGLTKYNIKHSKKTNEEIYEMILEKNQYMQIKKIKDKIQETIEIIKQSSKRNDYKEIIASFIKTLKGTQKEDYNIEANIIIDYYEYYQNVLTQGDTLGYDYSDLIYYAYLYLEQIEIVDGMDYKYIIIEKDEEVLEERYDYIINLAKKTGSKIITVEGEFNAK